MATAVNSLVLPWTVWPAFVLVLFVSWLLERNIRGRTLHGVISVCSLIAAFVLHKSLHPWDSSSVWLKGLSFFLIFLYFIESSQAIFKKPR
jgi:hypothetical protein